MGEKITTGEATSFTFRQRCFCNKSSLSGSMKKRFPMVRGGGISDNDDGNQQFSLDPEKLSCLNFLKQGNHRLFLSGPKQGKTFLCSLVLGRRNTKNKNKTKNKQGVQIVKGPP